MGKRLGITKSGRVMNPADRERKQMRMKELKRNKKERVKIRHAIVKSRDPIELIDHLEKLDDQEFNMANELAINVISDKRSKYKGAFIQMISLYKTEKEEKKVKELEALLQDYEIGRLKKEQHHKAQLFSNNSNPDEIPLPSGLMAPNAALTPYLPPPVPPQFHPIMAAGILKKTIHSKAKKHKYPPGPPCGLPSSLSDDEDYSFKNYNANNNEYRKRVQFIDSKNDYDEDYGPVDIPESMLSKDSNFPKQPNYSSDGVPKFGSGTLIPPGMAPFPSRLNYHPASFPSNYMPVPPQIHGNLFPSGNIHQPIFSTQKQKYDETNTSAIISAAPQMNKPTVNAPSSSSAIISAAPQMRNIKQETTRFVPTALKVTRPAPPVVNRKLVVAENETFIHKQTKSNIQNSQKFVKTADEACDEFLREIQDLL